MALIGELHRIAHQIDHHLPQAPPISHHSPGGLRVVAQHQLQPLGPGPGRHEEHHVLRRLEEVKGRRNEGHGPRFDLGQVQYVVDDVQQRFRRGLDDIQVTVLPGGELRPLEDLRHAEDAIHGGADLMAHPGQKCALGAVGRIGGVSGPGQLRLRFEGLGDIHLDRHEMGDPAPGAPHGVDGGPGPVKTAILALVAELSAPLPPIEDGIPQVAIKGLVLAAGFEHPRGLADELLKGKARHLQEARIRVFDGAVGIGDQDPHGALFDGSGQDPQAVFRLFPGFRSPRDRPVVPFEGFS